ncbi:MAG: glycerol-3-phosphate dehydrogenase/oxidase [Pirellulales bacterium]
MTDESQPSGLPPGDAVLDLLVIGGGIVGAGVAREAAMRGLGIALVEQYDYAFGTSSRSSRLLHGGLRYLAQWRLGLVREASLEKRIIHRIAPHLAQPLAFVFPTRRGSQWSKWKLSIGVKLYDLLCGGRNFGRSESLSAAETTELLPGVNQDQLTGAVRYYDALTADARLVIDTLRSAERHGAFLASYTRLEAAERRGDHWHCTLREAATGRARTLRVRAVVNAAGPWADRFPQSRAQLRLTKGVHLVIDRKKLPVPDAVVMPEDSRILFAIPWGERVILGTTDTDYDGPLDAPTCEPQDIRYVLDVVGRAFPGSGIEPTDVISTWAGLRPLIAQPDGRPSDISRRHQINEGEQGWWDVTGGKLTTYRLMGEQTVDQIIKRLGLPGGPSRTDREPLVPPRLAEGVSAIVPPPVSREVVEHYCRREWARHLDDVMIRRTSWRHYHPDHAEIAQRVAGWMAEVLGWDDAQREQELARCR